MLAQLAGYYSQGGSTLLHGLVAYWRGDESSGTRRDAVGVYDLHPIDAPSTAPGKVFVNALDFSGLSQRVVIASSSRFSPGDTDFEFAVWLRPESVGSLTVLSKWDTGDREYLLQLTSGTFQWYCQKPDASYTLLNSAVAALTNTWQLVFVWHDSINDEIGIQVNDNPAETVAIPAGGLFEAFDLEFAVGSWHGGKNIFIGQIMPVAYWGRVLTADERTAYWNGGDGMSLADAPEAYSVGLSESLKAFWGFNESSGARLDSVGSNDLSVNGTVTQETGKIGSAVGMSNDSANYLATADNADLRTNAAGFTVAAWAWFDDATQVDKTILGKWASGDDNSEYILMSDNGALTFIIHNMDAVQSRLTSGVSIQTSTWYLMIGWYDAINDRVGLQINDGTPVYMSRIAPVNHSPAIPLPFWVGRQGAGDQHNGRVDAAGKWDRVLNEAERAALWNDGNGIEYPF